MKQNTAEIRKENKKALPKYLLVILLCAVLGGIARYGVAVLEDAGGVALLPEMLADLLAKSMYFGTPVCGVLMLVPAAVILHRVKKMFMGWDGEDEVCVERMEYLLNWPMILSGLLMPIVFFFFSAGIVYADSATNMLLVVGELLAGLVAVMLVQQKTVDMTRMLNPEKKGSVYDTDFQKKWLNSCDENEQRQIGEAAYFSFKAVNVTCMALWAMLIMTHTVFQTGILPIAIVLVIWGVLQSSYFYACVKESRKKKSIR